MTTRRIYSWEYDLAKRYQEGATVPEIMAATARTEKQVRTALAKCGVPVREESAADRLAAATGGELLPPERELPTPGHFATLVTELVIELAKAGAKHFAALTAQNRTVTPEAFAAHPWVSEQITLTEMAPLLNLARDSVRDYNGDATRARRQGKPYDPQRFPPGDMPAAAAGDERQRWAAGDIALWQAIRESRLLRKPRTPDYSEALQMLRELDAQPGGTSRRRASEETGIGQVRAGQLLAQIRAEREPSGPPPEQVRAQQLLVARKAVAELGTVRGTDLLEILAKAGWPDVGIGRARTLLAQARQGALPQMEPDTKDGLVYASTIARRLGIRTSAIGDARRAGRLTPAEPKPRMAGGKQMWVFDPATMVLKYPWPAPVDVNYERCRHCRAGLHLTPAGRFPPHQRTIKGRRGECEGAGEKAD